MTLRKFFEDKNGKLTIIQVPNPPLIAWLAFMVVTKYTSGLISDVFLWLSFLSITIWSSLEIYSGSSMFRRVLGFTVLIFSLYSRFFT